MKFNFFTCTVLFFLYSFNVNGQTKLGIKAGGQLSKLIPSNQETLDTTSVEPYDTKVGYHFGIYTQLKLSEKFFIQPELSWMQRGAKTSNGSSLNLNYLALPLSVGFRPIEKLSISTGGEVSYLVTAKFKGDDIKDQLAGKEWDIGVNLGCEYQVLERLNVGIRGFYGFNKAVDATELLRGTELSFSNVAIQLSASFKVL